MITSLDIEYQPQSSVVIIDGNSVSIDIVNEEAIGIEVSLTNAGPQGPKGDKGDKGDPGTDNVIAGYPVVLSDLTQYDVLAFSDNSFTNRKQIELTDGGNF